VERRSFLKNTAVVSGLLAALPLSRGFAESADDGFPLMDLHVHLTPTFTIDQVMMIAKKTAVQFGIMVNPGGAVHDDASLRQFIDSLKSYPVYYGLQPMSPGWSTSFSPETIKLLDYVEMDPQTIPNGNGYGETLRIWNFDTYIDDPEKFMEIYMAHSLEVINNPEPLNIIRWNDQGGGLFRSAGWSEHRVLNRCSLSGFLSVEKHRRAPANAPARLQAQMSRL